MLAPGSGRREACAQSVPGARVRAVRCGLVRAQKRGDAEDTLTRLSSGWGPGRRWGARFLPRVGPDVALSRMLLS